MKKLLIIFLLSFSSCVFLTENKLSQTISEDNFLNRFPDNKKSIVIFKLNGKKRDRVYFCQDQDMTRGSLENCKAVYATNQYHILMLKPAKYYLFSKPENRPLLSENKIDEKQKHFASFKSKSGKVLYLGEITYKSAIASDDDLDVQNLGGKFLVKDNFNLIQKILSGQNQKQKDQLFSNQNWEINYLIDNYENLKDRLSKQLLENDEVKTKSRFLKN